MEVSDAFMATGLNDRAIEILSKISSQEAQLRLGHAYFNKANFSLSLEYYNSACIAYPDKVEARMAKAQALRALGIFFC